MFLGGNLALVGFRFRRVGCAAAGMRLGRAGEATRSFLGCGRAERLDVRMTFRT